MKGGEGEGVISTTKHVNLYNEAFSHTRPEQTMEQTHQSSFHVGPQRSNKWVGGWGGGT